MTPDGVADAIIERLRATSKYRDIHSDTIVHVVQQESAKAANRADLERRSRLKLHRVAAMYLLAGRTQHLMRGLTELEDSDSGLRDFCRGALAAHFSSAERLPDLEMFYRTVFDVVGEVGTVADVACALNPFSLPWLRDVTDAEYIGYDLNMSYVRLGNAFFAGRYSGCSVLHGDVLVMPASVTADVALLMKTYHMIEDRAAGAGLNLVRDLASPTVVVSFPLRTRTGRPASFTPRLADGLRELGQRQGWRVDQATLPTELLVFVRKGYCDGAPG
jgi:16S rRNA (guanine(1405)-N(7))-methyltransferase